VSTRGYSEGGLLSFLLLLFDDLFGFSFSLFLSLRVIISGFLFLSTWLLGWWCLASSADCFAVDLAVLSNWNGTAEACTGISLTSTRWASEFLLKLLVPPVTFPNSGDKVLLLWTNWHIIIGIRALDAVNITTIDVGSSVVWACGVGIMIVRVTLWFLGEALRTNLSIEDLISVFIMLSLTLEPIFSLLVSPWVVLVHSIIWADGSWIQIVNILSSSLDKALRIELSIEDLVSVFIMLILLLEPIFSLLIGPWLVLVHGIIWADGSWIQIVSILADFSIMVMLLGIDVEENVSVEAGVELWVVHAFLSKLNSTDMTEEGHDC